MGQCSECSQFSTSELNTVSCPYMIDYLVMPEHRYDLGQYINPAKGCRFYTDLQTKAFMELGIALSCAWDSIRRKCMSDIIEKEKLKPNTRFLH